MVNKTKLRITNKSPIKKIITRLIIATFLVAAVFTQLPAQNAYYDAIKLAGEDFGATVIDNTIIFDLKETKVEELLSILTPYMDLKNANLDQLIDRFSQNPFIYFFINENNTLSEICSQIKKENKKITLPLIEKKNLIKPKDQKQTILVDKETLSINNQLWKNFQGDTPTTLPESTVGGISVTTIADGLAKFLVKRVKEELSIAFFQKFKKEIKKDEYVALQKLFPETYQMLMTIDEEIYKFSSYIQLLRESFEKDLSNCFSVLPELLEISPLKEIFKNHQKEKDILKLGLNVAIGLKNKKHPGVILDEIDTSVLKTHTEKSMQNLGNLIELLQTISNSLRIDESKTRFWIDNDAFKKLFEKNAQGQYNSFTIYLGLIYQETQGIEFQFAGAPITFQSALKDLTKNVMDAKNLIEGFMDKVTLAENYLKEIENAKKTGEKLTYENFYKYYDTILDIIEYSSERFTDILGKQKPEYEVFKEHSRFSKFLKVARAAGNIYLDANQKNYSSLIFNVISLFDNAT